MRSILPDEKFDNKAETKEIFFQSILMRTTSLNYLIDYLSLILSSLLVIVIHTYLKDT